MMMVTMGSVESASSPRNITRYRRGHIHKNVCVCVCVFVRKTVLFHKFLLHFACFSSIAHFHESLPLQHRTALLNCTLIFLWNVKKTAHWDVGVVLSIRGLDATHNFCTRCHLSRQAKLTSALTMFSFLFLLIIMMMIIIIGTARAVVRHTIRALDSTPTPATQCNAFFPFFSSTLFRLSTTTTRPRRIHAEPRAFSWSSSHTLEGLASQRDFVHDDLFFRCFCFSVDGIDENLNANHSEQRLLLLLHTQHTLL